jgi:hypothetical protein
VERVQEIICSIASELGKHVRSGIGPRGHVKILSHASKDGAPNKDNFILGGIEEATHNISLCRDANSLLQV